MPEIDPNYPTETATQQPAKTVITLIARQVKKAATTLLRLPTADRIQSVGNNKVLTHHIPIGNNMSSVTENHFTEHFIRAVEEQRLLLALRPPHDPQELNPKQMAAFDPIGKMLQELAISINLAYSFRQEFPSAQQTSFEGDTVLEFNTENPGIRQLAYFRGKLQQTSKRFFRPITEWFCRNVTFISGSPIAIEKIKNYINYNGSYYFDNESYCSYPYGLSSCTLIELCDYPQIRKIDVLHLNPKQPSAKGISIRDGKRHYYYFSHSSSRIEYSASCPKMEFSDHIPYYEKDLSKDEVKTILCSDGQFRDAQGKIHQVDVLGDIIKIIQMSPFMTFIKDSQGQYKELK